MSRYAEILELFSKYVDLPAYLLVSSVGEAEQWNRFPAVVKLATMEHKTEKGGVVLGIKNREELKEAVKKLLEYGGEVLIQEQLKGVELFLGGRVDRYFGPVVSLGLGGIFVEVYKDISTRLAPLGAEDVLDMIRELRGRRVLEEFRGLKPDIDALIRNVVGFSNLVWELRPKLAEINPLIVTGSGAYAVDVRFVP